MYDVLPSFALGFHGCDQTVADAVFSGKAALKKSSNEYDWLGHGVYFWENNPERAGDYAALLRDRPRKGGAKVMHPAVVGAVIDLGRCLNLLDHQMIGLVQDAHKKLLDIFSAGDEPPPENRGSTDLLQRFLDCAVIEYLHQYRKEEGLPPFDTVRGVFVEGPPIYPSAGFHQKSHIQVCVCNPRCIKGYFRVLPDPGE